jgi:hypothetical protein
VDDDAALGREVQSFGLQGSVDPLVLAVDVNHAPFEAVGFSEVGGLLER